MLKDAAIAASDGSNFAVYLWNLYVKNVQKCN